MTTTDPPRRRTREWVLAAAVPLLLVAGCTRAVEPDVPTSDIEAAEADPPTDSSADPATGDTTPAESDTTAATGPDETTDDTTTDATEPDDTTTDATEPDDTATDATEPDDTTTEASEPDGGSTTDRAPTESDEAASDVGVADDADGGTSDPAAITIGAIVGAGLLLAVAALWMVRMNRSEDDTVGVGEMDERSAPGDHR